MSRSGLGLATLREAMRSPLSDHLGGGSRPKILPLGLRAVDEALPEAGLPRGAVVEIASPRGLGRMTTLALAACASAQAEARLRGDAATGGAWCAWIDPTETLFAPAVARAGVDLDRLLVVRPRASELARVAVRVAQSRAFAVIVVDLAGVPGSRLGEPLDRWPVVVRRLALGVEGGDAAVVLLTDLSSHRSMPLPVAMRIELGRPSEERLALRVAKDRRGHVTPVRTIVLPASHPQASPPHPLCTRLEQAQPAHPVSLKALR